MKSRKKRNQVAPPVDAIKATSARKSDPSPPGLSTGDINLRVGDRVAAQVRSLVPWSRIEQTRDVYEFISDDPNGLVLLVMPDYVELRLPTVEWTFGYAGPVHSSRLWKRCRIETVIDNTEVLSRLIHAAIVKRRRSIRPCHFCGQPTPPEDTLEQDGRLVCHGCASTHMGVAF